MNTVPPMRGRVAVVGAGPAGMATALSVHQAGHDVTLLERYPQARPAGNILNLWPPPVRALGLLGVDIEDLGAPCYSEFRSVSGRVRVRVNLSEDVLAKYGGGFIGLLRPDLYERMLAALPPGVLRVNRDVQRIEQDEAGVQLHMADGEVITADVLVGADGIDSLVRRTLWGDTPKREHNLHIFGGYTLDGNAIEGAGKGLAVLHHSRTVQGSWTAIRSKGRDGFQWWVLSAYDAARPFTDDLHAAATAMGAEFPAPLPQLIAATHSANVQRWLGAARPQATQAVVQRPRNHCRRCRPSHLPVRRVRRRDGDRRRLLPRPAARRRRPIGLCGRPRCPGRVRDAAQAAHSPPGPASVHSRQGLPSRARAATRDA